MSSPAYLSPLPFYLEGEFYAYPSLLMKTLAEDIFEWIVVWCLNGGNRIYFMLALEDSPFVKTTELKNSSLKKVTITIRDFFGRILLDHTWF